MNETTSLHFKRAIGGMFFALFGGLWFVAWCLLAFGAHLLILGLISMGTGIFLFLSFRFFRRSLRSITAIPRATLWHKGLSINKQFSLINIIQWIGIAIIARILIHYERPEWIVPAVLFIVGLHFVPLAKTFKSPKLLITGVAFILLAVIYPLVMPGGPASPVGCFVAGVILWINSLSTLTAMK